jgi:hypothetical protein
MRKMADEDTPANRDALYKSMLAATFVVPTHAPEAAAGEDGGPAPLDGISTSLIIVPDYRQRPVLPVFTDIEALRAWAPEGVHCVGMPARQVFGLALRNDITAVAVNPAGPTGGLVMRAELELLARGEVPRIGSDGQLQGDAVEPEGDAEPAEASLGAPGRVSDAQRRAVGDVLRRVPGVVAGHFFATCVANQKPRLVLGLEVDVTLRRGELERTVSEITAWLWKAIGTPGAFDVMAIPQDQVATIREVATTVYERTD